MTITLPVTVNGQIMPGGVDRYRFQPRNGQQLIIAVSARALIPYLADAVPGWFEAAVTLSMPKARKWPARNGTASSPIRSCILRCPQDGEYTVEIHDSIFRGREDFVYRLTMGELPFVTGIFPLGGRRAKKRPSHLTGWNCPATS